MALCGDIATHHSKYRQLHRVDALGICILMDEPKMDNIYLNNIEKEHLFLNEETVYLEIILSLSHNSS